MANMLCEHYAEQAARYRSMGMLEEAAVYEDMIRELQQNIIGGEGLLGEEQRLSEETSWYKSNEQQESDGSSEQSGW